jgi:hypothetical protein
MNHNLNYLFVYCIFVLAENSLNADHVWVVAIIVKKQ